MFQVLRKQQIVVFLHSFSKNLFFKSILHFPTYHLPFFTFTTLPYSHNGFLTSSFSKHQSHALLLKILLFLYQCFFSTNSIIYIYIHSYVTLVFLITNPSLLVISLTGIFIFVFVLRVNLIDRKSTRLNSSHRH